MVDRRGRRSGTVSCCRGVRVHAPPLLENGPWKKMWMGNGSWWMRIVPSYFEEEMLVWCVVEKPHPFVVLNLANQNMVDMDLNLQVIVLYPIVHFFPHIAL
jgi:hypothetical protein